MPSEHRLHPSSFVFTVGKQVRELLLPGLLVIFTAGSAGADWQVWLMLLVIPYAAVSLGRTLSYRYRFDDTELVVRTGFVFRNERRIPYSRIHNIDGVQHLVHRLVGVLEVRIQTGAGAEPEATMRVLPLAALDEMRARVFSRDVAHSQADAAPDDTTGAAVVLSLPLRELLLSGFIENRGSILIATGLGLLWEIGALERLINFIWKDGGAGRSLIRPFARAIAGGGWPPPRNVIATVLGAMAVLLVIRLISTVESGVRLYGFTLTKEGTDLRTQYGLLTRVSATIPVHRIQLLTIREGPLHRLASRVAMRVDSAGGPSDEQGTRRREPLAPILKRDEIGRVMSHVVPGIDLKSLEWQPAAPGAARREFTQAALIALVIAAGSAMMLRWWTFALIALLLAVSVVHAIRHAAALGWAVHGRAVIFKTGWLWRRLSIVPFSRMQAVVFHESPFDRRTAMASLIVDTAGASASSDGIAIPYMPRESARALHRRLAAEAARTEFSW